MTPLSFGLLALSVCGVATVLLIVVYSAMRLSGFISAAEEAITAMGDDDGEML